MQKHVEKERAAGKRLPPHNQQYNLVSNQQFNLKTTECFCKLIIIIF